MATPLPWSSRADAVRATTTRAWLVASVSTSALSHVYRALHAKCVTQTEGGVEPSCPALDRTLPFADGIVQGVPGAYWFSPETVIGDAPHAFELYAPYRTAHDIDDASPVFPACFLFGTHARIAFARETRETRVIREIRVHIHRTHTADRPTGPISRVTPFRFRTPLDPNDAETDEKIWTAIRACIMVPHTPGINHLQPYTRVLAEVRALAIEFF